MSFTLKQRTSGVLLHLTSLPGPHGCGDLGPEAFACVDFLRAAGQRWWQMLPIVPPGPGNSPYSSSSAFAGSPWLVGLGALARSGLLERRDLEAEHERDGAPVDYPATMRFRAARLRKAFGAFERRAGLETTEFREFCEANAHWLSDYALFEALRQKHRTRDWTRWPRPIRLRKPAALKTAFRELQRDVDYRRFVQFEFDRQWCALHAYANRNGIGLIGDIPIFVAYHSADVWAHRRLFQLDADGRPKFVSGVPPDMFSRTGQLWGHPHYCWRAHRADGFAWWLSRFRAMFARFDATRIDHFLGFHRVWAVPGGARTALRGRWQTTPGHDLFSRVLDDLGDARIIAEDLGVVTPQAEALRAEFGFPGLRLLQFAFDADDEASRFHQPHRYPRNCVAYPGTHDNDTIVGWFGGAGGQGRGLTKQLRGRRQRVLRYAGTGGREIHWELIRLAMMSPANTVIVPAQDLLGLDSDARMNFPGKARGNWRWRLARGALNARLGRRLLDLTNTYERQVSSETAPPGSRTKPRNSGG